MTQTYVYGYDLYCEKSDITSGNSTMFLDVNIDWLIDFEALKLG